MAEDIWEDEGGSVEKTVIIELSYNDAVYLMNKVDLEFDERDKRILDAFRYALLNGHPEAP